MTGAEIILLAVFCAAFAVALGVIIYNVVKGKSCCGDCDGCSGCKKIKKRAGDCDGSCPHCAAHAAKPENAESVAATENEK